MKKRFNETTTREYYDNFSEVYETVWNEQVHTGLFDKEKSLGQATRDMNVFLANLAGVRAGLTVIDVGCGRGGADRFLTKERGAKVIGVDLNKEQLAAAKKRADEEGFGEKIRYVQSSMSAIPIADGGVDIIWIQEAFFHCHDKSAAVKEFKRILAVDGLVVMEDTVLECEDDRDEVLENFGRRVGIDEILTPNEYERLFSEAGFQLEKSKNLSQHLGKTYEAIVKYIMQNQDLIRRKISPRYHNRIETAFDFPASLKLVNEGKLGCRAFVFKKAF